ncbi:P-loop containing nucleoside triphosphate hydrolase [Phytophthora cactorum]|nr:P-loop containing nucleoside triphosphate hydrolase [Phytophthora cactorum]
MESSQPAEAADSATSKWMKMISSTGGSTGVSQESLGRWAKLRAENGLDPTPELKIALVGGPAGKTSIVRRWLQRSYPTTYSPTVGVDVSTMTYKHCGQELLLHLWDVSSAEVDASASSLHSLLCEDLDGIFFVFNVHRVSSIAAMTSGATVFQVSFPKETPCFLISHKADLLQKRVMTSDDIAAYARAAGYKGWMWTVGKANFGENEKNPAVREALERMVEFICRDRIATEHIRLARLSRPLGILETFGNPAPLEVIQTDDALHHFSTSLLPSPTYGGSWILGNDKGVYLRATNSSLLGNDETDDDSESVEEFQFPFSGTRQINEEEDAAAAAESRRREKEEEDLERRREEEKAERDRRNDQEAWHFFAGSISRAHAEALLENREPGTFLLRRKDAQTLILSYVGPDHVHHVLIEFSNQRYHIGSSKASQATSFTTLWKCLRSVRRYAYRGLVFSRNVDFSVVNKQELVLEDDSIASGSVTDATTPTTPSIWRTRTRSGSSSSLGSNSRHASPTTAPRRARHTPGLQANQEQVKIPPQTRIDELSGEFYEHLAERLSYLAAQQKAETPEGDGDDNKIDLSEDITPLLEMVAQEKSELRQVRGNNAETQWRQLVKNMEAWNRIVMNLTEEAPLLVAGGGSCVSPRRSSTATSPLSDEAALELELGRLQAQLNAQEGGNRRAAAKTRIRVNKEQRSESGASSVVRSVKTAEKISLAAVVVHLLKGNIGPGAMSLPTGPVLFVIVALVSVYNMDLLLRCKQLVSPKAPMSFGDVGREILGPKGKLLIDVFLVGTQLGICCVYFTFVATNIHVVLPESLQEAINERQLIFAIFPILLMLSWVRSLRRITPFSGLANFAVLSGITIVFYYSIDYWKHPRKPRETTVLADWSHLPEFYGTAVYSFEGIGLVLPIQNAMAELSVPTIAFGRIDNGSMTAVLHDYCEGWLVTMANVALAFACTLSFPIQFYPAIDVLERMLRHKSVMRPAPPSEPVQVTLEARRRGLDDDEVMLSTSSHNGRPSSLFSLQTMRHSFSPIASPAAVAAAASLSSTRSTASCLERLVCNLSPYECNRTLFRSMLCTSLMMVAVCVPDVGLLISLFGSVGSSMLAIVLPPILYLVATGSRSRCLHASSTGGLSSSGSLEWLLAQCRPCARSSTPLTDLAGRQ